MKFTLQFVVGTWHFKAGTWHVHRGKEQTALQRNAAPYAKWSGGVKCLNQQCNGFKQADVHLINNRLTEWWHGLCNPVFRCMCGCQHIHWCLQNNIQRKAKLIQHCQGQEVSKRRAAEIQNLKQKATRGT